MDFSSLGGGGGAGSNLVGSSGVGGTGKGASGAANLLGDNSAHFASYGGGAGNSFGMVVGLAVAAVLVGGLIWFLKKH